MYGKRLYDIDYYTDLGSIKLKLDGNYTKDNLEFVEINCKTLLEDDWLEMLASFLKKANKYIIYEYLTINPKCKYFYKYKN